MPNRKTLERLKKFQHETCSAFIEILKLPFIRLIATFFQLLPTVFPQRVESGKCHLVFSICRVFSSVFSRSSALCHIKQYCFPVAQIFDYVEIFSGTNILRHLIFESNAVVYSKRKIHHKIM